jgi:hypothetical protein
MKKLWRKLKNYINDKGLIKILAPALVLVIALVALPEIAQASPIDNIKTQLVAAIVTFHAFIQALLAPMIMIAAALMDNSILLDPAMESKLLQIWVEIRNWVNIVFVLVLVGIALYNVLGIAGDGSNYALKAILPKIVIGLVAVNFSFLAGKLLIDSVGVLTDAVYSLPTNFVNWEEHKGDLEIRLCNNYTKKEGGGSESEAESEAESESGGGSDVCIPPESTDDFEITRRTVKDASVLAALFCEKPEGASELSGCFSESGNSYFHQFGQHNATAAIMINMGLINDIDVIEEAESNFEDEDMSIKDATDFLSQITLQSLFGIFMFILFGFAFAALIVVLIARLIILWICLALSPVIVLFFVFPDLASAGGGEVDLKDKFFKHLFVPLIIGVVFSVGFTMLSVLYNSESGSWTKSLGLEETDSGGDATNFNELLDHMGDSEDLQNMVETFPKDATDFQDLLIAISAVLIIWIGVFAAADQTVASSFTGTIKDAGKKLGSFAAKMPLYLTTIPVPGVEGGTSLGGLLGAPGQFVNRFDQKMREDSGKVTDALMGKSELEKKYEGVEGSLKGKGDWSNFESKYLKFDGALSPGNKQTLLDALDKMKMEASPELKAASSETDIRKELIEHLSNEKVKHGDPNQWGKDSVGSPSETPDDPADPDTSSDPGLETALSTDGAVPAASVGAISGALVAAGTNTEAIQSNAQIEQIFDEVNDTVAGAVAAFNGLDSTQKQNVVEDLEVSGNKISGASFTTAVGSATNAAGGGTGGDPAPAPELTPAQQAQADADAAAAAQAAADEEEEEEEEEGRP